jgi:hypothetical protein
MDGIGSAIGTAILIMLVVVGIVVGAICYWVGRTTQIKSKVRIIPEMVLTTDGKTVDTLFIYKKP